MVHMISYYTYRTYGIFCLLWVRCLSGHPDPSLLNGRLPIFGLNTRTCGTTVVAGSSVPDNGRRVFVLRYGWLDPPVSSWCNVQQ